MNTILVIDKREAVPVRAIPYITGWSMSPDVVALTLAHTDHWRASLMNLFAYHLSNNGQFAQMLPKEWDGLIAQLESLSNMYQMDENFEGGNYVAWRKDSIPLLPPATFLWRDELEQAFKVAHSPRKLNLLEERPGDRELNFFPFIPENHAEIVMKGFELLNQSLSEKPLLTRERESLLKLVIGMAKAGYRYDPNAPRNDAIGDISRDLESNGVPLDQDTIRKWLKEATNHLPAKPTNT